MLTRKESENMKKRKDESIESYTYRSGYDMGYNKGLADALKMLINGNSKV